MAELEQYIKSYFGVIESEELITISQFFNLTTLKKGEYLAKEGKPCNQLSFIQSGILRIYTQVDGKEVTQWIATSGYFMTDLGSFIFENPTRWTIQALVDTEIYSITKQDYKNLNKIVPKWNEFEKLFILKCFTMMEDRIFSHLSMSAEERFHLFFENNQALFNQVPLQYIASMLGMTPETFSRIRRKQLL